MARVNIFDLAKSISKESISHPDVSAVKVDAVADIPDNVKEDTAQEDPTKDVDAEVTNTKTTEPGPANGGGDGTAQTVDAKKATTKVNTKDLHFDGDQNGGREIDELPNKVSPKDGLKPSDISTSVEEHKEEKTDGEDATLKTVDAGGAESVGEADDLVMDIDDEVNAVEVTGILTQTETDAALVGKILEDVGQLETAKASVERYIGILDSMANRGVEMSNELRATMSIGLKSISVEMFATEVVTLEQFRISNEANDVVPHSRGNLDDDTEFDGARDKTRKGLSGKLGQLWEALKRAFDRTLSAVQDLWRSFTTDTTKVSAHLKDLRKRVSVLEGGKEIPIANATRLTLGDEFVGDSPEAIKRTTKMADELLLKWPSSLAKIFDAINRGGGVFAKNNLGEVIDSFEDAIEKSFQSLAPLSPKDRNLVPSGFLDVDRMSWSKPLVGNRALYVGVKRSKNDGLQGTIEEANAFSKAVNISFSAIPGYATNTGAKTITTPSAGEAASVIRELEVLINTIVGRQDGMKALKDLTNKARDKTLSDMFVSGMGDASVMSFVIAYGIASSTITSEHAFIGYLLSTIKAYIGFLEGSIKAEQASSGSTIDA